LLEGKRLGEYLLGMNRTLISLLAILLFTAISADVEAKTTKVPPILKVSYEEKLSSEPVLVQVIPVPGISVEAAKDAVTRAAMVRKWTVETLDNGDIQTNLVHRSSDSTLTFKFKTGEIEVWSVSYKINKKTKARKSRDEPEGWIRNLHKDILDLLGLLTK
jgi:hypothetical protein